MDSSSSSSSSSHPAEWCLVESDAHIFMSLVAKFGAKDVEVCDVWDAEHRLLAVDPLAPQIYGLVFLFKWSKAFSALRDPLCVPWQSVPGLFFARQVVPNACATQAILSILLNCDAPGLDIGPALEQLRDFAISFPPDLKGHTIGESDVVRCSHNSFAPMHVFEGVAPKPEADEADDFHFVAFVPKAGVVYEIDGLLSGPIPVGRYDDGASPSWAAVAHAAVQQRVASFPDGEIRFNLMIIQEDRRKHLRRLLSATTTTTPSSSSSSSSECSYDAQTLLAEIADDDARHAANQVDFERRRYNYVPLVYALLKKLARVMPSELTAIKATT